MVDAKYGIAYSEVLEILKYIPKEDYNKIPKKKIDLFKEYASKDYIFKYQPSKTLDEQNVSKIAKGIIAILFRDYWATPSQREKIIKKQNNDRLKIENEKAEKYNPDIFKINNSQIANETFSLVKIEKEKWYIKLLSFIKKLLKNSKY